MKERETVSWEEFDYSNYLSIEAIVSLLIRKKILTKEENLDGIMVIKHAQHSKPE